MEYKDFLELLMHNKELNSKLSELSNIGFDLFESKYELITHTEGIFQKTLELHFTEEGVDWVNWFIFENDYGQKDWSETPTYGKNGEVIHEAGEPRHGATDENGEPICYSFESLWEHIQKYSKDKQREIIYGVFLKKDNFYFGYFKSEEDAIEELKIQGERLYPEIGVYDEKTKHFIDKNRGDYLVTIHSIVLR